MKTILYYISGHGFGHSVRSSLVIRELYKLGIRCEIISSAPQYIFDVNLKNIDFGYHYRVSDIGLVQKDSISLDLSETFSQWSNLLDNEERWMAEHLEFFEKFKPVAIVSDISPFPLKLAKQISVPSVLLATFRWDWILDFYKDDDPAFEQLALRVGKFYDDAGLLITTPFSFGLSGFNRVERVSLIGKKSSKSREEIRKNISLDERPAVLFSFGGHGLEGIDIEALKKIDSHQFIFMGGGKKQDGNIRLFDNLSVDHEDLVKASDFVCSKPGYGITCETILNQTGLIYTSRGKFAEYQPMVDELKLYIPTRFIPNDQLLAGRLEPYIGSGMEFSGSYKTDSGQGAIQAAELISRECL